MTVLELWGGTLIAFGPGLAMFSLTIADDPIKIILLISSAFFWLLSFLAGAIVWSIIRTFCDYLIIGVLLAVMLQESFRYLTHIVTKKAQQYLATIMESGAINDENKPTNRASQIRLSSSSSYEFNKRLPLSYVSGLGFGLMNGAFSLMNVLSDHAGPGSVGLKGDSPFFLLVSSLTALAFILLNISWSIIMSESIEKSDRRLAAVVVVTHLLASLATFMNRTNLQLISIILVYSLMVLCGLGALKIAGIAPRRLLVASAP